MNVISLLVDTYYQNPAIAIFMWSLAVFLGELYLRGRPPRLPFLFLAVLDLLSGHLLLISQHKVVDPRDLGRIAVASNQVFWEIDEVWRNSPQRFVKAAPTAYQDNISKREPFLDGRRKRALFGQRNSLPTRDAQARPIVVWVAELDPHAESCWKCVPLPREVAMEMDQVLFTLTGELGVNAYPHVLRWIYGFLTERGVRRSQVLARMPNYYNEMWEAEWQLDSLSAEGAAFDNAVTCGTMLDPSTYGKWASAFSTGCEGTNFDGRGKGHNLGVLLFGKHFQEHFKNDEVLAAQVAIFLCANSRYRFHEDPTIATEEQLKSIEEGYDQYVATLKRVWLNFGTDELGNEIQSHPAPSQGKDPSVAFIRELEVWRSRDWRLNRDLLSWFWASDGRYELQRRLMPTLGPILYPD